MNRGRLTLAAALLCAASQACSPAQPAAPIFDIVIRNGRVLDGAGNPWIAADVAIRDGRFVQIGQVAGSGRVELDATGKYVTPGWIDMLDQSGEVLLRNGLAESKLQMGVTTAIAGEAGTPVPLNRISEYLATLRRQGISLNFGTYFSAAQVREAVLGTIARAPTAAELTRMRALADTAMRGGALGMTSALIYPPGSYAATDELVELARVVGAHGGLYATHVRGEGKELEQAIGEAIHIGELVRLPVEIFHFKAAYRPGWGTLLRRAIVMIDEARRRGVDVAADIYPYTISGSGLETTIPSWVLDGGPDSARARLTDPSTRTRLKREVVTGSPGWWNTVEASGGWENIVVVTASHPANARFEGKSVAAIAREWNKEPADAAWDLVLQANGRVNAVFHMMTEGDVEEALRQPWVSIGSDAGAALIPGVADGSALPHPRAYGTFPRIIARYVRERGVLTLAEAVRRMTSWPAKRMRLDRRGLIAEGFWADAVVFDADSLRDHATFEDPARFPTGIDYVLVNGTVVIDHGRHTTQRSGMVIEGPAAASLSGR